MRALYGQGTSKEAAEANRAVVFGIRTESALVFGLIALCDNEIAAFALIAPGPG